MNGTNEYPCPHGIPLEYDCIKCLWEANSAVREENQRLREAIANVRARYPESVFPADGESLAAQSGTFARLLCDNILKEYDRLTEAALEPEGDGEDDK